MPSGVTSLFYCLTFPYDHSGRPSKHPPAKPEALRLLAPQGGLIAIVKSQNHAPSTISSTLQGSGTALPCPPAACIKPCILPELSNLYCLPGKAGGTPGGLVAFRADGPVLLSTPPTHKSLNFKKPTLCPLSA